MSFVRPVPWTRQPQFRACIDRSTYSAAWEAWIPSGQGRASNNATYSATPSTRAAFGIGPNGTAFTFTGAEFTAAWTFSAEPSVTSECWLVVVGPTLSASSTSGTIFAGSNSVRWNSGGMKVRASSTDTASSAVAPSPGDAILFVCKNADYRIYHKGVKTTAAGGFGWSGITGMLQKTGDSASLVARLTNIVPDDANIWRLLDNPWQLFAPITRRIWVPSAGGATTHTSTGALAAQAASIAGTATHKTLHTSTGALAAQAATIASTADHTTPSGATHTATGALAAQAAEIAGTAIHRILHTSTGDLIAQSAAVIAGTAIRYALHTSSGALASQSATMSGSASGPGPDDVSGDTIVALRSISHNTHRRM